MGGGKFVGENKVRTDRCNLCIITKIAYVKKQKNKRNISIRN